MPWNAIILGIAIVFAGFLAGGRYTTAGMQSGVYIVDRFTGSATHCVYTCTPAPTQD